MKHAPSWLCTGLEVCGVVLVTAVCLPVLALGLFLLRAVVLAAAVAAVALTFALYCLAPGFRARFNRIVGMAEWRRPVAVRH